MVVHRVYFISKYYLKAGCDFSFLIPNFCAIFFKISVSHVLLKNALSSIISLLSFDLSSTPSFRKKCPHCGIVYPFFLWKSNPFHLALLNSITQESNNNESVFTLPNKCNASDIHSGGHEFSQIVSIPNSLDSQGSQRNPHISLMP